MELCTEHWQILPRELRDRIYRAKRKPEKYAGAIGSAVTWLSLNSRKQERKP
jgi:hypothetical protein